MCAMKRPDDVERASSRRLTSFQAGPVPLKVTGMRLSRVLGRAGPPPSTPYQPTPKPSPFVVSTPIRECRLWSMSECSRLYNSSSSRIGVPEYASHRPIAAPPSLRLADLAVVIGRSARHGVSLARQVPIGPHSDRMRVRRSVRVIPRSGRVRPEPFRRPGDLARSGAVDVAAATEPPAGRPRSERDAAFLARFNTRMQLPIVVSAILPLLIVPGSSGWVGVVVGVVTWLVF